MLTSLLLMRLNAKQFSAAPPLPPMATRIVPHSRPKAVRCTLCARHAAPAAPAGAGASGAPLASVACLACASYQCARCDAKTHIQADKQGHGQSM
jgi:hypothetical protein